MTWTDILARWQFVLADLLSEYGVDLHDPAYAGRSWLWLRGLIDGLLTEPNSRLVRSTRTE